MTNFESNFPSNPYTDRLVSKLATPPQSFAPRQVPKLEAQLKNVTPSYGRFLAQSALAYFSPRHLTRALEQPRQPRNQAYLAREARALQITGTALQLLQPDAYPINPLEAGIAINATVASAQNGEVDGNAWESAMEMTEAFDTHHLPLETYPVGEFQRRVGALFDKDALLTDRLSSVSLALMIHAAAPEDRAYETLATTSVGYIHHAPASIFTEVLSR